MDMQKTGRYIQEKRNNKGLTQADLAELVGVSVKTIGDWEKGKVKTIHFENLKKLAEVLGVTVDEIIKGEDAHAETGPSEEIEYLTQRIDGIQTVLAKVEDRGLATAEFALVAYCVSLVLFALDRLFPPSHTGLGIFVCAVYLLFGIGFFIYGSRKLSLLGKRLRKEREQEKKS